MATFWPATNPASFRPCSNAVARCSEPAAVVLRRKPITGTADCWARAASGHDAEVLLRSLMNSRRLTGFTPSAENHLKSNTLFDRAPCTALQQNGAAHVRFGSKADIRRCLSDVRFTPKSRHWNSAA